MSFRRSGTALSVALLLQVLLGGWALPCRDGGNAPQASSVPSAHHHEAPPQDDRPHDASACMTAPACTVLMVEVPRAAATEKARAARRVDLIVGDPRSVVRVPELPPPRG
ncbi:MAG: hypothetical protein JNJ98_13390 [Gemmatimonadetes bacterium]|nr:hypothetical protein [Gemmatimonadota bacterium]